GTISVAMGWSPCASGEMPASRKNVCAPTHIENAGAAVLKAMRSQVWRRRYETMPVLSATVIVAGAGPNSIAEAMKNVSVTKTVYDTDAAFIVKTPVSSASVANRRQMEGGGKRARGGTAN